MGEETAGQPLTPESKPSVNNGKDLLERMAGFHPETKQMVEELTMEGLGRTIIQSIHREIPTTDLTENQIMVKTAAETKGLEYSPKKIQKEQEILGIILPCNKGNNEHIIILVDGSIFLIKPDQSAISNRYDQYTNPSEEPVVTPATLTGLRHSLRNRSKFPYEFDFLLSASSDQPEQQELILSKTRTALELAREIKMEREETKQETANKVFGLYQEFFHPPQPPQQEGPPESPQQE